MFNKRKFEAALKERGITMKEMAKYLSISTVTLYRKLNGVSDFTYTEINLCRKLFGKELAEAIFFADKVA